ncbi:MAG TPA: hypothetical protein VFF73_35350 [Planctomycetota bacterium]|nr:hypothetical protein [Planctomycetota bacterium]
MAQQRQGSQPAGEPRGPRTLEEALRAVEPLALARGQLVVTDGACDVRLAVERGHVELELLGHELPAGLTGDAAIIRAVADTLFWDAPLNDVNAGAPRDVPQGPKPRPRLVAARADAPREICRAIAEEASKLEAVRRRIPSLNVTAQAGSAASSAKGGSPIAVKLRGAIVGSKELNLQEWARAQNLTFIDVATAAAELVDANEARIAKKDAQASAGRAEAALKSMGFCPGLRAERAARTFAAVKDTKRAAVAFVRAGHERISANRLSEAIEDFNQAASLESADGGIAAREGLLAALEAEAKDPRRSASAEQRSPQEAKKVALELGRTYFALGLMNRARAAFEKALDDQAPPDVVFLHIEALVGAGQVGRALDRAEAVAPKLDRAGRRKLAQIVAEGARGPSLERALAIAGVQSERRTAAISLVAGGLFGALALALGYQGTASAAMRDACADVKAQLATSGPTPELAARFKDVASRYSMLPVGAAARDQARVLELLAADRQALKEHRGAFAWRSSDDPDAAHAELQELEQVVKTDAVRSRVKDSIAALDKQIQGLRSEIALVKNALELNDGAGAIDAARTLVEHYPGWKGTWKDLRLPVRIMSKTDGVIVEWNGERVSLPTVVYVSLGSAAGTLRAYGELGSGLKPETHRYDLANLPAEVTITLERDPTLGPAPDKPTTPTTTNPTTTTPTTGTGTSGKTDPKKGGGKISIGGGGPDATTPERPDDENRNPTAQTPRDNSKLEVREVRGADLQKLVGGSTPLDVQPTPGYFDFLLTEMPRGDTRLRLAHVDVVTRVKDKKVYLHGVRIYLEDTTLHNPIPVKEIELDDDVERVISTGSNGRRTVAAIDKCSDLDQPKFKSQVRDGLVSAIREFNKREGE